MPPYKVDLDAMISEKLQLHELSPVLRLQRIVEYTEKAYLKGPAVYPYKRRDPINPGEWSGCGIISFLFIEAFTVLCLQDHFLRHGILHLSLLGVSLTNSAVTSRTVAD
jgi:hypothetical protein